MLFQTLICYCSFFTEKLNYTGIRIFLESSPNYPNLLSVMQTLQFVGLKVNAGQCEWDYLRNIELPFLLHLKADSQESLAIAQWDKNLSVLKFYNIKKKTWDIYTKDFLDNYWDGVVLYTTTEVIKQRAKNITVLGFSTIFVLVFIFLSLILSWASEVYAIPIAIGLMISICLYWRKSTSDFKIIDKLCHISSSTDCDSVETSSYSSILGIRMDCLALTFFLSQLICVAVTRLCGVNNVLYSLYLIAAIVALPTTGYSVYGQFKIKKICPLCAITIACVFIEAILFISIKPQPIYLNVIVLWSSIALCVLSIFQYLSNIHLKADEELSNKIQILKLKRKREVLLLESSPTNDISSPIWLGKEISPISITTILSPSCRHCRKLVQIFLSLIDKGIEFRWNIILGKATLSDSDKINLWIQKYYWNKDEFINDLTLWSTGAIRTLTDVSVPTNLIQGINTNEVCRTLDNMVAKLNISSFPKIILNNRLLSSMYTPNDIEAIITDQYANIQ